MYLETEMETAQDEDLMVESKSKKKSGYSKRERNSSFLFPSISFSIARIFMVSYHLEIFKVKVSIYLVF